MKRKIVFIALCSLWVLKFNDAIASKKKAYYFPDQSMTFQDTLIDQLTSLNLSTYEGKPVDTLLASLPSGYSMKIGGWHSQRIAEVLYLTYPNKVSVEIHVHNFQYMDTHLINTANPTQNWDIALFRKERITYTIVFNGSTCINGCENEYK